jgi:hypothetical protein
VILLFSGTVGEAERFVGTKSADNGGGMIVWIAFFSFLCLFHGINQG